MLERPWLEKIQREVGAKPIRQHLSPDVPSLGQRMETAQLSKKPFQTGAHRSFRSSAMHQHKGTLETNRDTRSKKAQSAHTTTKLKKRIPTGPLSPQRPAKLPFHLCFLSPHPSPQLLLPVHGERRHSMQ